MFMLIVLGFDIYFLISCLRAFLAPLPVFFWLAFSFLQILFISQIWLYTVFFKSEADVKIRFESFLRTFAFHSMGFISFLLTLTFFRDIIALVFLIFKKADMLYGVIPSELILGTAVLLYIIGFLNAKFRVDSPRVPVEIENLPVSLKGLRIVQLSDMHLGTGPNAAQIGKLVDQALALKPDLIALTGDIFDGNIAELGPEIKELARLKAPQGVYFVLGNHECYWNWKECVETVKKLGFIPLLNEGVTSIVRGETIFIAGVNDPAAAHAGGTAPQIPLPPSASRFNLVLVHQPQLATKISEAPYHLQLSGHTHGGQFFPWNLAVKKMYPISGGLGLEKKMWVYVSHGSGYWGPPIRLGTQGEVTELILTGRSSAGLGAS